MRLLITKNKRLYWLVVLSSKQIPSALENSCPAEKQNQRFYFSWRAPYSTPNASFFVRVQKFSFALLTAATLLAGCETKPSETKDQLSEAGQDTAVMACDGKTVADAAANAAAAADNAWDMTKAKLAGIKS